MKSIKAIVLGVWVGFFASDANAFKVGLVFDKGGKDDKSFNNSAFIGASKAQKELGIELTTVEATDNNAFEPLVRNFAKRGFDLVVSVGFAQAEAMQKVAAEFPSVKFAIVDSEVKLPNVRSLLFEEHEGSFLVGALAAKKSKSGHIGFIGGMDIPLIRRFQMGYEAGAKFVNPKIKFTSNYVGISGEAWNNPPKAKELAVSQFNQGADVIYAAAGASGLGLFDAAEEKKKLAIGVDSNQNWIKPGFVLTSMMKRVDVAVFDTIKMTKAGSYQAGVVRYGLQNSGVGYAMDKDNEKLIDAALAAEMKKIEADIIAKKISVPDYYLMKKK